MNATQPAPQTVDIRKNDREVLRIRTKEFQGNEYVDLRIWYEAQDGSDKGELRPTKKGVTFRRGLLPEVLAALHRLPGHPVRGDTDSR